jgi:hypothetical protein
MGEQYRLFSFLSLFIYSSRVNNDARLQEQSLTFLLQLSAVLSEIIILVAQQNIMEAQN